MSTTVHVNEKTLQMLNKIKKEMNAKSHDETIIKLIEHQKIVPSMFGSNKKLNSFIPQDEATEQEKKETKKAKQEIVKGSKIELQEFIKDIGC